MATLPNVNDDIYVVKYTYKTVKAEKLKVVETDPVKEEFLLEGEGKKRKLKRTHFYATQQEANTYLSLLESRLDLKDFLEKKSSRDPGKAILANQANYTTPQDVAAFNQFVLDKLEFFSILLTAVSPNPTQVPVGNLAASKAKMDSIKDAVRTYYQQLNTIDLNNIQQVGVLMGNLVVTLRSVPVATPRKLKKKTLNS